MLFDIELMNPGAKPESSVFELSIQQEGKGMIVFRLDRAEFDQLVSETDKVWSDSIIGSK